MLSSSSKKPRRRAERPRRAGSPAHPAGRAPAVPPANSLPTAGLRSVRRNPGGAPSAFTATVLPHKEELLAAAMRYTRNRADAEDLVQDTFARALGAWSRFEPGSNCRAWLFRILTNGFISGYRRRRRHQRFAHETGDEAVTAFYGESFEREGNPADALLEAGLGDEVESALAELGEDYLKVVLLADLRGARYRDIATELNLPIGTVMSRLFRARRQLEERLRDYAASDYGIRRAA